MLRDLLRAAFLGEETFESGVLVHLGGPRLFFARLGNIIADESALKMAFDAKGASGLRCCPGCNNVMLRGSDLAERDRSGYLVELTCADLTKFDWSSDEDIVESIDLLLRSKGVMGLVISSASRGVLASIITQTACWRMGKCAFMFDQPRS